MTVEDMWDMLVNAGVVSEETLQVVTSINGYSEDTLCDVLYAVEGYHDFEQWAEDNLPWWDIDDGEDDDEESEVE